ncbi:embryo defective 1703 [Euphorbia peplus]|nr:embryo defective 1703 [Euphorbia peplus]
MELLNSSIPPKSLSGSQFFSFISPKFTLKFPYKFHTNPLIPVLTSAHLGRTARRRNSLRKKLIADHQVPQNITLNPSFDFVNPNINFENSDNTSIVENLDSVSCDLDEQKNVDSLELKVDKLGNSTMANKLEKWVDQYAKETAYWGVGSGNVFTVFHDLEGNVKRVVVHEDEIVRRIQELGDPAEVSSKILYAKGLAREMERGENVIPRNSSVAKFVMSRDSRFVQAIRDVALRPEFIPVVSGYGKLIFCGVVAIWALTKLFTFGNEEQKLTELEKEMMRRKIKSRKEGEILEKGTVEVVSKPSEFPEMATEKPKLDKQELAKNILAATASKSKVLLEDSSSFQTTGDANFDEKIKNVRAMARETREIENGEAAIGKDREEKQPVNEASASEDEKFEENIGEVVSSEKRTNIDKTIGIVDRTEVDDAGNLNELLPEKSTVMQSSSTAGSDVPEDSQTMVNGEVKLFSDTPNGKPSMTNGRSITTKSRLIRSVKEARQYLAEKSDKQTPGSQVDAVQESATPLSSLSDKVSDGQISEKMATDKLRFEPEASGRILDPLPATDISKDLSPKVEEYVSVKKDDSDNFEQGNEGHDLHIAQSSDVDSRTERKQPVDKEKWLEKNFHEVEPIIKKIGDGFRGNYKIAREKANENAVSDVAHFEYNREDGELEWMKDDDLSRIVFQVRDNELSGRDPFYLMDADDKAKFFEGLEKKVERENEKLSQVHEYLHSNIENLDYGADGISLYDRPEKFIPRWKGPVLEKKPEFLNFFEEERRTMFTGLADNALRRTLRSKDPKDSKTVIEASDGSVRAGKKTGKEFWQHTKKWSRGFVESYNAEEDPEIKSVMKDMGKDLDRWITEDEIQEAADLITKLPERNKEFVEKKINKIKREMELFGPQAVVSKYREYDDDKGEDYLWWLDLPHVLCIELYTSQNGEDKVGFYSLEMAADLELEPKPYHVIAFEDASDSKNLCCIIQTHMEMLGNGQAFVVPRPPKDAFREAKANGFGVTVIRKRELKVNVDQTLEEVEEQISEIGSKMYHDMLMKERSVDMSALMKGALGFKGRPTATAKTKRSKRTLKKPRKK